MWCEVCCAGGVSGYGVWYDLRYLFELVFCVMSVVCGVFVLVSCFVCLGWCLVWYVLVGLFVVLLGCIVLLFV